MDDLARGRVRATQDTFQIPEIQKVLTPKRPAVETAGLADIFPYYAGFSFDWARDLLAKDQANASTPITVLDPWNGSGTTTLAAQSLGFRSVGIDRNPIANIVARLRCGIMSSDSIKEAPSAGPGESSEGDPLRAWFTDQTSARIRQWVDIASDGNGAFSPPYIVSLFRVVRSLTKKFEGSNPTWVKRAKGPDDLIGLDSDYLDDLIQAEYRFLVGRIETWPVQTTDSLHITASATRMPIASSTVDVILTSPPYLTRIDYAVAYARELAVLGIDIARDRSLRSELMGTTLIRKDVGFSISSVGPTAQLLLSQVQGHKSKASSGYYLKQAQQYLSDLCSGLDEISRVSRPGASIHLVVQDSYYKDVPVPLADICIEEGTLRGWSLEACDRFPVRRSLTALNTSARAYKKSDVAESVISFRKD
ncbi:hypothetical protein AB0K51_15010 [Kitasatospora sp. NPDC049285]|uniref:hypothetical protein n=1 Tax=Kitasatospora sp. NPDC049285 TaxID=3157096 RepID=UPI0034443B8E